MTMNAGPQEQRPIVEDTLEMWRYNINMEKTESRHWRPSARGNCSASRTERQDKRPCAELGQNPRGSPRTSPGNRQATKAGVVWPRYEASYPLQNHHARHRRGRTQTLETTKELVRQRQGLDGDDFPRPPVDGRQQNNSLEEDVCFFCPRVPPTTSKSRD